MKIKDRQIGALFAINYDLVGGDLFAKYAKDGGANIARAAIQARKLGIEISDVASSINSVRGLIGKKLSHFTHGYKTSDSIQTTAIVLSSGFQSTIFDDYDPLSTLLAGKEIDDDLECNLDIDIGIDTISEA